MSAPESVSFITQMLEACERIREKYMIGHLMATTEMGRLH